MQAQCAASGIETEGKTKTALYAAYCEKVGKKRKRPHSAIVDSAEGEAEAEARAAAVEVAAVPVPVPVELPVEPAAAAVAVQVDSEAQSESNSTCGVSDSEQPRAPPVGSELAIDLSHGRGSIRKCLSTVFIKNKPNSRLPLLSLAAQISPGAFPRSKKAPIRGYRRLGVASPFVPKPPRAYVAGAVKFAVAGESSVGLGTKPVD